MITKLLKGKFLQKNVQKRINIYQLGVFFNIILWSSEHPAFKLLVKLIYPETFEAANQFILPTLINGLFSDTGTGREVEKQPFHFRKKNNGTNSTLNLRSAKSTRCRVKTLFYLRNKRIVHLTQLFTDLRIFWNHIMKNFKVTHGQYDRIFLLKTFSLRRNSNYQIFPLVAAGFFWQFLESIHNLSQSFMLYLFVRGSNKQQRRSGIISNFTRGETFCIS